MNTINPQIGLVEKQLIIGTVLGGSSIVKTQSGSCYLYMRDKDTVWLDYKANRLKLLTTQKPFTLEKATSRWHSQCYPIFSELREIFYKGENRCISFDRLDKAYLHNLAFATWYMDCGVYYQNNIILNTNIWGDRGSKEIIRYFKILGWDSNIFMKRRSIRVQLDVKSSLEFIKIIEPEMPTWSHR